MQKRMVRKPERKRKVRKIQKLQSKTKVLGWLRRLETPSETAASLQSGKGVKRGLVIIGFK